MLLNDLKNEGIETGIISNGNRAEVDSLLDDPTFLNQFKVIVMSGDPEVGGVSKPSPKIFNVALSKMSVVLGREVNPLETTFLTETVQHFRVYVSLYSLGIQEIL